MKNCKTTCPMSLPTGLMLLGFLLSSIGYISLAPNIRIAYLFSSLIFVIGLILIIIGLCIFAYNLWANVKCGR